MRALAGAAACPAAANLQLETLPARLAWQQSAVVVSSIHSLLGEGVTRHTQDLYRLVIRLARGESQSDKKNKT